MVAGVPLMMLGAWQVFLVAPGTSLASLTAWCLVLHIGYTMMVTPHGGWSLEISRDYHERTRIMGARVWITAAGMPLIVLLPSILERGFGATRAEQVGAMGMLLILLVPLSVLPAVRFLPEPPMDRAAAARTIDPVRQFVAILRDSEQATILALYALAGLAEAASSATFIFFVEQAFGLQGWASTLMLVQAITVLAALPLWGLASHRLDKRRALIGVFVWQACATSVALFLPAGALGPLIAYVVVRSASMGGDFMLLRAMVADVAGRDAAGGLRRSGSYFSLFNVTLKLAMSFGAGAALWLQAYVGFAPGAVTSASSLSAVRLVHALPACLSGMAGLLIMLGDATRRRPSGRLLPAGSRSAH